MKKYLKYIEIYAGKRSRIKNKKIQLGDIVKTQASLIKAKKEINFTPKVSIKEGIKNLLNGTNYTMLKKNRISILIDSNKKIFAISVIFIFFILTIIDLIGIGAIVLFVKFFFQKK